MKIKIIDYLYLRVVLPQENYYNRNNKRCAKIKSQLLNNIISQTVIVVLGCHDVQRNCLLSLLLLFLAISEDVAANFRDEWRATYLNENKRSVDQFVKNHSP